MSLEKLTWFEIVPKALFSNLVFGFANCGEFNVFSASARNSAWKRSVTAKFLNIELSQFFIPGPLYEIVRDRFPKLNAGAEEKAAVLM